MADEKEALNILDETSAAASQTAITDVELQPETLTLPDVEPLQQNLPVPNITELPPVELVAQPVEEPKTNATHTPRPSTDTRRTSMKEQFESNEHKTIVTPTLRPSPDNISTSMKEQFESNEHDLLNEQFENYLRIGNALMRTLKRPKDIKLCSDLLRRVQKLNDSRHPEVKRNNNRFIRYCLRIIKYTSDNQPLEYYRRVFHLYGDDDGSDDNSTESRTWFEENKSYMALKTLKDGTFIVYMAVANEPKAGWQEGGLAILEKKGACGRV